MYAAQKTADSLEDARPIQLGRPAALAGEHSEAVVLVAMQCCTRHQQGWDDGNFLCMESMDEFVFFKNPCVTPPRWSIKLHYHGRSIFNTYLIDTVLVTIKCKQATIPM